MRCLNCGYEHETDFVFCPHCGAPAGAEMKSSAELVSPDGSKVLAALKDPSFLTICILLSVSCGATLLGGGGGVPLIILLIMIFLWQVYGKSKNGMVDTHQLRNVSGAVYANYIVTYVGAVLVLVVGVIFGLVFGVISANTNIVGEILESVGEYAEPYRWLLEWLFSFSGWLFTAIFIGVAIVMIVLNLLMLRPIHRFAKAVYQAPAGVPIDPQTVTNAKLWLIVSGVLSLLEAVSSLLGGAFIVALGSGGAGLAAILASTLITKYFID